MLPAIDFVHGQVRISHTKSIIESMLEAIEDASKFASQYSSHTFAGKYGFNSMFVCCLIHNTCRENHI